MSWQRLKGAVCKQQRGATVVEVALVKKKPSYQGLREAWKVLVDLR